VTAHQLDRLVALPEVSSLILDLPSLFARPCRHSQWHALAEPELYKTVSLSSSRSYMLLGRALSSPSGQLAECDRARRLRRWIKRAVLRNVPSHVWRESSSGWGRVLGGLRDLDSLKVRFADSAEGRLAGLPVRRSAVGALADDLAPPDGASDGSDSVGPAGEVEGAAPAEIQMEPSVWATYPNLNPRMYVPISRAGPSPGSDSLD
jgi:hypothetical protein